MEQSCVIYCLENLSLTKTFNRISSFLNPAIILKIYKMIILPILDYGCIVWGFDSPIFRKGREGYNRGSVTALLEEFVWEYNDRTE